MKIPFTKMHGAGNDFVLIDDRSLCFPLTDRLFIQRIAARRTGIGCEGIILLQPSAQADVRMRFFNPDGCEVDMCGNGARCFARWAHALGAVSSCMTIETRAGTVHAEVFDELVRLRLPEPTELMFDLMERNEWSIDFVNSGVPHAVVWVEDLQGVHLEKWGPKLRYDERFMPQGSNVNFAQVNADGTLSLRTYERGVEAETMACGTGAVAVGVLAVRRERASFPVTVHCAGEYDLLIDSNPAGIMLSGGAEMVFEGEVCYGDRV